VLRPWWAKSIEKHAPTKSGSVEIHPRTANRTLRVGDGVTLQGKDIGSSTTAPAPGAPPAPAIRIMIVAGHPTFRLPPVPWFTCHRSTPHYQDGCNTW
jgi:hypothetical protein